MKRETIFKTILILTVGAILFAMPVNVFAEAGDLDDFWDDQGGLEDIGGETTQETPSTTPEPEPTPSTPTTQQPEETLPHAGVAEDTIMVVSIAGLVMAAIFAYRKINEYQNI